MKRILFSALLSATTFAALAPAAADGPSIVVEMAEKALAKGYGGTCSLEMKPVRTGGYYPCLDFGPYRYVRGYGMVQAFVIQEGKRPFPVLSGPEDAPAWTYSGPWQEDMPARMVLWWNDVVEGMAEKAKAEAAAGTERAAAENYIKELRGEGAKDAAQKDASEPQPLPNPVRTEEISPDIRELLVGR